MYKADCAYSGETIHPEDIADGYSTFDESRDDSAKVVVLYPIN